MEMRVLISQTTKACQGVCFSISTRWTRPRSCSTPATLTSYVHWMLYDTLSIWFTANIERLTRDLAMSIGAGTSSRVKLHFLFFLLSNMKPTSEEKYKTMINSAPELKWKIFLPYPLFPILRKWHRKQAFIVSHKQEKNSENFNGIVNIVGSHSVGYIRQ